MISITQLKYVCAVHQLGHFGRAAEKCNVTQPTLSTQIQKAEAQLGFAIFVRDTKPVSLTRQGQSVMVHARQVLDAYEQFSQLARGRFDKLSGELVVGVIPTLAPYLVPLFLKLFTETNPCVNLTIVVKTTEEIVLGLRQGQLDAGLLATPLGEDRLAERPLFNEQFYVYAARGEPLLQSSEVSVQSLDRNRLWLLPDGHCLRHQTLAVCSDAKGCSFLPSVRFEASSLETVQHLVDTSGGYTLVPECFARLMPKQVQRERLRPFAEPVPSREISLLYPAKEHHSALMDALWRAIDASLPPSLKGSYEAVAKRTRIPPRGVPGRSPVQ